MDSHIVTNNIEKHNEPTYFTKILELLGEDIGKKHEIINNLISKKID
jgi:hypothetical protein